jgi:hypothetical protein
MKKVKVTVLYCASNEIEVEAPDNLEGDDLRDYVQAELNRALPKVHQGSDFEFPMEFQLDGDDFTTDLKG